MNAAPNIPGGPDISAALRDLLLQRAAGKLSSEEFERRQAGLYADLLAAPVAQNAPAVTESAAVMAQPEATATAPQGAGADGSAAMPARPGSGNRRLIAVAAVSVVCFAAGLQYWMGGAANHVAAVAPRAASGGPASVDGQGAGSQAAAPAQPKAGGDLTVMVKRLAEKMAADPKNGDGWLLLARTYGELQQAREAAEAYAKAAALLPADAAMLADWAAVTLASHDNKWDEQSRGILKRALAADPRHLKTLVLAGAEAYAREDKRKAIEYWEQLKKLAPAESPEAKLADANLAEARAGGAAKSPANGAAAPSKPAP